jgi:hypothetical protein
VNRFGRQLSNVPDDPASWHLACNGEDNYLENKLKIRPAVAKEADFPRKTRFSHSIISSFFEGKKGKGQSVGGPGRMQPLTGRAGGGTKRRESVKHFVGRSVRFNDPSILSAGKMLVTSTSLVTANTL